MTHHDKIISKSKPANPPGSTAWAPAALNHPPCSPTWPGNGRVVRSIVGRQSLDRQPIEYVTSTSATLPVIAGRAALAQVRSP